jgi:peptidoglycan hydrolase CwlO-like protein
MKNPDNQLLVVDDLNQQAKQIEDEIAKTTAQIKTLKISLGRRFRILFR